MTCTPLQQSVRQLRDVGGGDGELLDGRVGHQGGWEPQWTPLFWPECVLHLVFSLDVEVIEILFLEVATTKRNLEQNSSDDKILKLVLA